MGKSKYGIEIAHNEHSSLLIQILMRMRHGRGIKDTSQYRNCWQVDLVDDYRQTFIYVVGLVS